MTKAVVLVTLLVAQSAFALADQPRVIAHIVSKSTANTANCGTTELQVLDNGLVITTMCGQNATTVLKLSADGLDHLRENRAATLQSLMTLATDLSSSAK